MSATAPKQVVRAIRRPEFKVVLELPPDDRREYRLEAADLDGLADIVEREIRAKYPNHHVGVRLDPDGNVWCRLAFHDSRAVGTWAAAS